MSSNPAVNTLIFLMKGPPCSPGEWEPGEGERRPEEGGEAADGGGQVSVVRAEQPRASVHGPDPSDPWPALPSSSRQLPPTAHHRTTLPALTRTDTEGTCCGRTTDLTRDKDWMLKEENPDRPTRLPNSDRREPKLHRVIFRNYLFSLLLISLLLTDECVGEHAWVDHINQSMFTKAYNCMFRWLRWERIFVNCLFLLARRAPLSSCHVFVHVFFQALLTGFDCRQTRM